MRSTRVEAGRGVDSGADLGGRRVEARTLTVYRHGLVVRRPSEPPVLTRRGYRILLALLMGYTTMGDPERGNQS